LDWDIKEIDKSVSLKQISECSNVPIKDLRFYNPELKQSLVPPLKENEIYEFRLPKTASDDFDSLFALIEISKNEIFNVKSHRVRNGENLSLISKKYQVPMKDIISYNKIINPDMLKPKTYLQIPINYEQYLQEEANKRKKIYHTVKRGDTIGEVAEIYKTSVKNIKKWNGLRTDVIKLGQKLEIWVKAGNQVSYSSTKKSYRTYKVRYGDTLSEIAEKYGIRLSQIKKWNSIGSTAEIKEGQILKISPPY
jgi:membrane-bound lytic murein transglycosylase D